jgi:hypothetical protein
MTRAHPPLAVTQFLQAHIADQSRTLPRFRAPGGVIWPGI